MLQFLQRWEEENEDGTVALEGEKEDGDSLEIAAPCQCPLTLNRVPNQKVTTVSLFSWHHTYSADMIRGTISSWRSRHRLRILARSRTIQHTPLSATWLSIAINMSALWEAPLDWFVWIATCTHSVRVCHQGMCQEFTWSLQWVLHLYRPRKRVGVTLV